MAGANDRFLVTGAAGCIGAWAVRALLDDGVEVVASDLSEDLRRFRLASLDRPSEVEFLQLDVTRTDDVVAAVEERGITHIVHLAGLQLPFCAANPPLGAMVNVVGTVNVFEAVKRSSRPVGLAYASSAAVYGASGAYSAGLVGDLSALEPDSHYGVYKAANEGTARVYSLSDGVGSIGLRPFVVYGLGRDQGMTSEPTKAMLAAAAGTPYRMKFGGNVLLTHAEDCARSFIAASRAAAGSGDAVVLNVPGRRAGIAQLVAMIERIVPEVAGQITFEPRPLTVASVIAPPTIGDVIGTVFNRSLEDGVASTIEQFRTALASGLIAVPEA